MGSVKSFFQSHGYHFGSVPPICESKEYWTVFQVTDTITVTSNLFINKAYSSTNAAVIVCQPLYAQEIRRNLDKNKRLLMYLG